METRAYFTMSIANGSHILKKTYLESIETTSKGPFY